MTDFVILCLPETSSLLNSVLMYLTELRRLEPRTEAETHHKPEGNRSDTFLSDMYIQCMQTSCMLELKGIFVHLGRRMAEWSAPRLECGFQSRLGLKFSGFSMWHFLKFVIGGFLSVLLFPPLFHRLMVSTNEIMPN